MNNETRNNLIAAHKGWTNIQDRLFLSACMKSPVGYAPGTDGPYYSTVPDYSGDLNVIHAAINDDLELLEADFYGKLESICYKSRKVSNPNGNPTTGFSGWIAHATAENLCDAYIAYFELG